MPLRPPTVALVVALAALLPAPVASALVVSGDTEIGSFAVKGNGTLDGAIKAFGEPSSLRRVEGASCAAGWRKLGLSIGFYNLGGQNPCAPRYGYFGRAIVRGKQWRTSKGLRIGDPPHRLRAVFPRAERRVDPFYGSGWWLLVRYSRIGEGGSYPGLMARVRDGRVYDFVVRYPAGGE